MVYDWSKYEKTCFRLYIEEKKSLAEIMDHMKQTYEFTPSKRAYQTQFRKWNFPGKRQSPDDKDELVAKVKELWERNLSQGEILDALERDGFEVSSRELTRIRNRNQWLLRSTNHVSLPGASGLSHDGDTEVTEDIEPSDHEGSVQALSDGLPSVRVSGVKDEDDDAQDKFRGLEIESHEKRLARKRRRRTHAWRGLPADPPGPPRFPSETTVEEGKAILGLDTDAYNALRALFQNLCENAGVTKKTLAGPEQWEHLKSQLVQQTPSLQTADWTDGDAPDVAKLALEVICTDVTKRMRMQDNKMLQAEAKNILGLNPKQTRDIRSALYALAVENGISSKLEISKDRWLLLKQDWIEKSDVLRTALAAGDADANYAQKMTAVEMIARDVIKRVKDDQTRRHPSAKKRQLPPQKSASGSPFSANSQLPEDAGALTPDAMTGLIPPRDDAAVIVGRLSGPIFPNGPAIPSLVDLLASSSSGEQLVHLPEVPQQEPMHSAHSDLLHPNMLASHSLGTLEPQIDAALLLGPDAQSAFLGGPGPYLGPFAPTNSAATQGVGDVFHQQPPHHHLHQQALAAVSPQNLAVYIRLHPNSSLFAAAMSNAPTPPPMWIATLASRSVHELRQAAADKHPGFLCVRVEGILKSSGGGGGSAGAGAGTEMALQIDTDDELAAYLGHVQAVGTSPVFNVQLQAVPEWDAG